MDVFYRYAPFIQDYIFRSGWQTLRGVQNAAGEAIFGTDANVLLTASTASGKTALAVRLAKQFGLAREQLIVTSAQTGQGIGELKQRIEEACL